MTALFFGLVILFLDLVFMGWLLACGGGGIGLFCGNVEGGAVGLGGGVGDVVLFWVGETEEGCVVGFTVWLEVWPWSVGGVKVAGGAAGSEDDVEMSCWCCWFRGR